MGQIMEGIGRLIDVFTEALCYVKNVSKFPGIKTISSYSFGDPQSAFFKFLALESSCQCCLYDPVSFSLSIILEISTCSGQKASLCTSVETWVRETVQEVITS